MKLGYFGLLAVLLIFVTVWGFEKARGQVPVTGSADSGDNYAPKEGSTVPPILPTPTATSTLQPAGLAYPAATLAPGSLPEPTAAPNEPASIPGGETLLAVGDIATCSRENDEAVAAVVQNTPGTVLLLGDNVYESGSLKEFLNCFDPAWSTFIDRIKPSPGNHEYRTADGRGYYEYFGAAAGDPSQGYYSFDVGTWHIISLNSNCSDLPGGCAAGSAMHTWLQNDLVSHPSHCTLAYWHHPRFSSGGHGSDRQMKPLWDALYAAGVEVVLNGHDHNYERFAPQTPDGQLDPVAGIRQFVVGTGGKSLRSVGRLEPNSEANDASTYGLLKLTLGPGAYTWEFIRAAGGSFSDSGIGSCH